MTGLRWSPHGTLWPPQIDAALLLRQSVERPSGSGIYVVMPDPEMTVHEAANS
ncbi:hypothetical protein [Actinacidiphila alni]|uniref:hypothetical protein n=1 Tax=Actinacidiphila alni TaxID=380248 RepID=UPI0034554744